jgi:hypothetical protein
MKHLFSVPEFNVFFLLILLFVTTPSHVIADSTAISGQKPDTVRYWKSSGRTSLNFNQNSFSNWAVGGENSISGKANVDFKTRFEKNKISFEHNSKMAYGVVGYGFKRIEKTDDRLEASVSLSHKAIRKWTYTSLFSFKSQFTDSYKYPNDSVVLSSFLAPGYLNASIGFNYRPTEKFEVFVSPASGKFTIVTNQSLADKGAFGVQKAVYDSSGMLIREGANLLCEFGINVLTKFTKDLTDNVELISSLNLYNNYLDDNRRNRWNIDLDWETSFNFTISKYFQTVLFLHLKYDHDISIQHYEIVDGERIVTSEGPRLQFKESIGIGLMYKI